MLHNKVAIITGGSSGIGLAIAKQYAENGAAVAIMGRDQQRLNSARLEIKSAAITENPQDKILTFKGDVKNLSDIKNFIAKTKATFGNIDIVVANAAALVEKTVEETSEEDYDTVMDTNAKGTFFTVHYALPAMNDDGAIILISSIAAKSQHGMTHSSVYAASKAAVSQFASSMTAEIYSERGIRINVIEPGFINTPIFNRYLGADPQFKQKRSLNIPAGRMGKPEEVANMATFLASQQAKYISGQTFTIDGGVSSVFNSMNSGQNAYGSFSLTNLSRENKKVKLGEKAQYITEEIINAYLEKLMRWIMDRYYVGNSFLNSKELYRELSLNTQVDTSNLKESLIAHMQANKTKYTRFCRSGFTNKDDFNNETKLNYTKRLEILILMATLNRPVLVISNKREIRNHEDVRNHFGKPIFIFCDNNNHFTGLTQNPIIQFPAASKFTNLNMSTFSKIFMLSNQVPLNQNLEGTTKDVERLLKSSFPKINLHKSVFPAPPLLLEYNSANKMFPLIINPGVSYSSSSLKLGYRILLTLLLPASVYTTLFYYVFFSRNLFTNRSNAIIEPNILNRLTYEVLLNNIPTDPTFEINGQLLYGRSLGFSRVHSYSDEYMGFDFLHYKDLQKSLLKLFSFIHFVLAILMGILHCALYAFGFSLRLNSTDYRNVARCLFIPVFLTLNDSFGTGLIYEWIYMTLSLLSFVIVSNILFDLKSEFFNFVENILVCLNYAFIAALMAVLVSNESLSNQSVITHIGLNVLMSTCYFLDLFLPNQKFSNYKKENKKELSPEIRVTKMPKIDVFFKDENATENAILEPENKREEQRLEYSRYNL